MASLLRQIVAGPRARHPEAGLDLCYVTDKIIATSGPSGTFPQRAYRNPLDSLVKFLDAKHADNWAIWEFRAEGTGYPDSEVYNRVYHYPFPDHHPPPFALIPNIMASMRNWLHEKDGRVVVVHCKAGKGRSGTASCSYLISEEGWPVEKALQRFTERRMRPNMGKGVSIPSQLRWIGYVDRWAKHGKLYVERQVEILEVHCWGLRDGVKIQIEGFVDEGKRIKSFHTFTREEREIVRGEVKPTTMAQAVQEVMYKNGLGLPASKASNAKDKAAAKAESHQESFERANQTSLDGAVPNKGEHITDGDVVFRPSKRVVLATNDINLDVERRNKAAFDVTMVTAVAHVWFNTFFEGNGPEQNGIPDEAGVFVIGWEAMDGIKGSSRKGTQAFEKVAVVWKSLSSDQGKPGTVITQPKEGEEVKQSSPADWKGELHVTPSEGKDIGMRMSSPTDSSSDVSGTSSAKGQTLNHIPHVSTQTGRTSEDSDTKEVKSHYPDAKDVEEAGSGSGGGLSQLDGVLHQHNEAADKRIQSPKSDASAVEGVVVGLQHVSTDDLPGGRPERDMDTKEHKFLHLAKKKATSSS